MGKKNTVMHIISSLNTGGAEKLFLDTLSLCSNTDTDICEVALVTNNFIDTTFKAKLVDKCERTYFLGKDKGAKSPKYLLRILRIIKEERVDVIHAHDYGSKMWAILCKAVLPKLKIVYTFHSTHISYELKNYPSKLLHKLFVDMNIAISETVRALCVEEGISRVTRIYNGIDLSVFKQRKSFENDIQNLKIVSVARINHEVKGQDIIIKALKRCLDKGIQIHCSFIGDYENYHVESHRYLLNLAKELGIDKNIEFLGKKTDICNILQDYDAFVLASRTEGLGLAVLEAMAADIPVVASKIEGLNELLKDKDNGILFECENDEDLSRKLINVLFDFDLRQKLCINASKFVKDFDIREMYRLYCQLYKRLTGGIYENEQIPC